MTLKIKNISIYVYSLSIVKCMVKIKKERIPKKKGRKNRVSHGVPCPSFHLNYYREDGE